MSGRPDLSGDYVLDRQASTVAAAAIESAEMQIEHRDPSFRCHATFVADGRTIADFSFEVSIAAPTAASADGVPPVRWEGDLLTIEHRDPTTTPPQTMTWRYGLIEEGRRLRAFEEVRGTDHDQDNVWIFNRR